MSVCLDERHASGVISLPVLLEAVTRNRQCLWHPRLYANEVNTFRFVLVQLNCRTRDYKSIFCKNTINFWTVWLPTTFCWGSLTPPDCHHLSRNSGETSGFIWGQIKIQCFPCWQKQKRSAGVFPLCFPFKKRRFWLSGCPWGEPLVNAAQRSSPCWAVRFHYRRSSPSRAFLLMLLFDWRLGSSQSAKVSNLSFKHDWKGFVLRRKTYLPLYKYTLRSMVIKCARRLYTAQDVP